MAAYRKFHGITMKDNSVIENLFVERLSSDPVLSDESRLWYNTTDKTLKVSIRDNSNTLTVRKFIDDFEFENWKQGLIVKEAVDVNATSSNIDPSLGIPTVQDGYTLLADDRILITNATDNRNNGIYVVSSIESSGGGLKIPRASSDNDDIVVEPNTGITGPIQLILNESNYGTAATISEDTNNKTVTLTLEKQEVVQDYFIVSSQPDLDANVGGSFRITAKTTSPYKGYKFTFSKYYSSTVWSVRKSVSSYGDIASFVISIYTESFGWVKTIQEVVDYLNGNTVFNTHFTASVETDASKVFGFDVVPGNTGSAKSYYVFKRNNYLRYNTTASNVLTLLNSTTQVKATVNSSTTIDERFLSVFGSTQFSVYTGSFNGTVYTTSANKLKIELLTGSPFYGNILTNKYFMPTKMKVTFTGTCSSIKVMSSVGYSDNDEFDCIYTSIDNPVSDTELNISYIKGIRGPDDYFTFALYFTSPSNDLQISDIKFNIGSDYYIRSDKVFALVDGTQSWVSIFGPDEYRIADDYTQSWDGAKFVTTTQSVELRFCLDSSFSYTSIPLEFDSMRITYTGGTTATVSIPYGEYDALTVDNYTSGTAIDISYLSGINRFIVTLSTGNPEITNVEFYEGLTGYTVSGRINGSMQTALLERSSDANNTTVNSELRSGVTVFVESGDNYAGTQFTLTTPGAITIGTTPITFTQFTSAADISVGVGLEKNGNQISIKPDGTTLTVSNIGIKVSDSVLKTTILSLDDVPNSYGSVGQILAVNSGATGMEFITPASGSIITAGNGLQKAGDELSVKLDGSTISASVDGIKLNASSLNLTDVPASYGSVGQVLVINPGANGYVYETPKRKIIELNDVPNSYGTTGQVLAVNSNATGLEFTTIGTSSDQLLIQQTKDIVKVTGNSLSTYTQNNNTGIDSNAVIVIHGGGTDGMNNFVDYSSNNFQVIPSSSNVKFSSTQTKYNKTSIRIPKGEYLKIPYSSIHELWNCNYTIEFDVFIDEIVSTNGTWFTLMNSWGSLDGGNSGYDWQLGLLGSSFNGLFMYKAWPPDYWHQIDYPLTGGSPLNRWVHIVVTGELINSTHTTRMYCNGTRIGSFVGMGNLPGTGSSVYIGSNPDLGTDHIWSGYIDNIRISKNISRYSASSLSVPTSYFAPSSTTIINTATSLNDADIKLENAIIALKNNINANVYKITTSTPLTQHTITHNLNSDYLDVMVWVYDDSVSKYVNDSVAITMTSNNALTIDLVESANIRVIVEKKDNIVLS